MAKLFFHTPLPSPASTAGVDEERKKRGRRGCLQTPVNVPVAYGHFCPFFRTIFVFSTTFPTLPYLSDIQQSAPIFDIFCPCYQLFCIFVARIYP